jgi:hypothetical protein
MSLQSLARSSMSKAPCCHIRHWPARAIRFFSPDNRFFEASASMNHNRRASDVPYSMLGAISIFACRDGSSRTLSSHVINPIRLHLIRALKYMSSCGPRIASFQTHPSQSSIEWKDSLGFCWIHPTATSSHLKSSKDKPYPRAYITMTVFHHDQGLPSVLQIRKWIRISRGAWNCI